MYAQRIDAITPFEVMQILARAEELTAQGAKVIHFEVGEPDFATAEPILKAGHDALDAGATRYTAATGIAPLREAISEHYRGLGVAVDPARIVVTNGASGGLSLLCALLLNPDEELLITDPGYPCNEVFVRQVGAVPKTVAVAANTRFQPTVEDVAAGWGAATRGMLLASPANPTGSMIRADDLADLIAFVTDRQGFVILDEIYQGLTMNAAYQSGLQVSGDLFVLNSFSKYFGMTGWRLGWIVVPDSAIEGATKLAQNLFICPSAPAQHAAVAAFSDAAMVIHEERAEHFRNRSRRLAEGLRALGFSIPVEPDGAFYLYVDVSHTGLGSREFCSRLLEESHVAVTPGTDFGDHQSDRFVRFAFTTSDDDIEVGLNRIAAALAGWGIA